MLNDLICFTIACLSGIFCAVLCWPMVDAADARKRRQTERAIDQRCKQLHP